MSKHLTFSRRVPLTIYIYICIYTSTYICIHTAMLASPTQWYGVGTRSHIVSILVNGCHLAASRPADLPPPLWFGGLAFFHDCELILIVTPCSVWCGGCAFSLNCQLSFAANIQTSSLSLKCGWLSASNDCHRSCQVIQRFPLPPCGLDGAGHAPSLGSATSKTITIRGS